jgi:hypothetical protein
MVNFMELTLVQKEIYACLGAIKKEDISKLKNQVKPILAVEGTDDVIIEYEFDDSNFPQVLVIQFNDIININEIPEKDFGRDLIELILFDDDQS